MANKLTLEDTKLKHVNALWVSWLNSKKINRYSPKSKFLHSIKTQRKFIKDKKKNKNNIIKRIFLDDAFIGLCEIDKIDNINKTCEIKYMIGDIRYLNRGYGTKLINLIKNICIKKLRLNKINASVVKKNKASLKVLQKNGFKIEGIQKKQILLKRKYTDIILLGYIRNKN